MKASKPLQPKVLIVIGVLLALMTGALILAGRKEGALVQRPTPPAAVVTVEQPVVELATAVPTPTGTATPGPTVAVTPTPAPVEPTITVAATTPVAPEPTRRVEVVSWQRVQVEPIGIGLQIPAEWAQRSDAWAWSPDGSDDLLIGLAWAQPEEGWIPGAMLPPSAITHETRPINLGWSRGTSYLVEVPVPAATVERHVIVPVRDDLVVDFYARGATTAELAALEPVLDQILKSIIVGAYAGDPVDVSVQFLAALLNHREIQSYLSSQLQRAIANGQSALALLGVENLYSSFSVTLVAAVDGRMTVRANLDYGAGHVEERLLTLVQQDGAWRIDEISQPG